MPLLHLLIFKTPLVLKSTAHWALFLPDEDGAPIGLMFHAAQESLTSNRTCISQMSFDVRAHMKQIQSSIVLPDLDVVVYQVWEACQAVSDNRAFNLVTRNIQHWVCEVIEFLQERLNIAKK